MVSQPLDPLPAVTPVQPIYEELSRASERRMQRVAARSQALCTVLYAVTCVSAYALFGEATSADVLANYDSDLGLSQVSTTDHGVRSVLPLVCLRVIA